MLHNHLLCSLGGQFSKSQPKHHNFNLFFTVKPINGSFVTPFNAKNDATETSHWSCGISKILDNLCIVKCNVVNLYKANWLTEAAFLFGLVFFVKKANSGSFCNTDGLWSNIRPVKTSEIKID